MLEAKQKVRIVRRWVRECIVQEDCQAMFAAKVSNGDEQVMELMVKGIKSRRERKLETILEVLEFDREELQQMLSDLITIEATNREAPVAVLEATFLERR